MSFIYLLARHRIFRFRSKHYRLIPFVFVTCSLSLALLILTLSATYPADPKCKPLTHLKQTFTDSNQNDDDIILVECLVPFRPISYFDLPVEWLDSTVRHLTMRPLLQVRRFVPLVRQRFRVYDLVILIPTVYRPNVTYLHGTVSSLLAKMNATDASRTLIVVSVNEMSNRTESFIFDILKNFTKEFPKEISNGLIHIVAPPKGFYMNFYKEGDPIGDSPQQFVWRSKQVIDYAFMFSYVFTKRMAKFVLLLEDDVRVTESGFVSTMLSFPDQIKLRILQRERSNILWYEFASDGAFGRMFPMAKLPIFFNIFTSVFYAEPVDWLLGHTAELLACRYYHTKQKCDEERKKLFKVFPRTLFEHIAQVSTAPIHTQTPRQR